MNLLLSDAAVMSGGALKAMRVPKFVSAKTVTSPSPTIGRVVSCAVLFGVPKKMTSSVQRINSDETGDGNQGGPQFLFFFRSVNRAKVHPSPIFFFPVNSRYSP